MIANESPDRFRYPGPVSTLSVKRITSGTQNILSLRSRGTTRERIFDLTRNDRPTYENYRGNTSALSVFPLQSMIPLKKAYTCLLRVSTDKWTVFTNRALSFRPGINIRTSLSRNLSSRSFAGSFVRSLSVTN